MKQAIVDLCLIIYILPWITTIKIDIYPSIDTYVLVGKSFNITCSVTNENKSILQSLLQVQICHTTQTCHDVDSSVTFVSDKNASSSESRIYMVHKAKMTDTGWYRCKYGNNDILPIRVNICEAPVLPDHITCISPDLFNLTCTWEEKQSSNISTNFSSFYSYATSYTRRCPKEHQMGCYWPGPDAGNEDEMFDFFERNINVTLEARHFLASVNKTYSVHIPNIVQLSMMPLTMENKTEKNISVSWTLPKWYTFHSTETTINAKFWISSKWSTKPQEIQISYSDYSNGQNYEYTFRNLVPFTNYTVQMQSIPKSSKYWSEISTLTTETNAAAPSVAPELPLSAFYTCTKEARYQINGDYLCILLKSIPDHAVNSYFANYSIHFTIQHSTINVDVDYKVPAVPITNLILPSSFTVDIFSYNDVGRSANHAFLTIHTLFFLKPRLVMVNIDSAGNYDVSWITNEMSTHSILHVNVYWCKEVNNNGICASDVGWKTYPGNATLVKRVLCDKSKMGWLFAVGFVSVYGQSGGLTFARKDCVFSPANLDSQIKPEFTVNGIQNDTTTLMLTFRFKYCDFHDRPTEYRISYMNMKSAGENYNCSSVKSMGKSDSVTSSLDSDYYLIENLLPSTDYAVCIDVLLADNTATESIVKTAKTFDMETYRSKKTESTEQINVIAGALSAVFLIGLSISLFFILKRKCYDNEDVSISVPNVKLSYIKVPIESEVVDSNDAFSEIEGKSFPKTSPYNEVKDDSGHDSSMHSNTNSDDSLPSPISLQEEDYDKHIVMPEETSVRTPDRQTSDEGFEEGPSSQFTSKHNFSSSDQLLFEPGSIHCSYTQNRISAEGKTISVSFSHGEKTLPQDNEATFDEDDYSLCSNEDGYRKVNVLSDSSDLTSNDDDETSSLTISRCSVIECSSEQIDSYTKCDVFTKDYFQNSSTTDLPP